MKKSGLFIKIFAYTIIAMMLIVIITAALFYGQFFMFSRTIEREQIDVYYQPLVDSVKNSDYSEIPSAAQMFREGNQSFEFSIVDDKGDVIYATPEADTSDNFTGDFYFVVHNDEELGYSVIAQTRPGLTAFYNEIIVRAFAVFAIMLLLCLISAYIFARQITDPIKQLAYDTSKMAKLEDVKIAHERRDELGDLTRDVHAMYEKLKDTIARLESEIIRVREMEETQLYFFSAASHELKTPIAAASVLLEGMLENVGDYKDHPKYLRECIKLADAQSKTVAEILEIVSLIDGKLRLNPKPIILRETIPPIIAAFKALAESAGQQIELEISGDAEVTADEQMLNRVLSNVILNAVQNAPSGAKIRIWDEQIRGHLRLCVLNTDTHIDEEILPKLFDPFFRADKARGRKDKRSGLGLTIVQKTLKAMDVNFALENTTEGVLFWMDLQKG